MGLIDICRLLNKYNVDYLIIGGDAVAFYGVDRVSLDTDIWIKEDINNYKNIVKVLYEAGYISDNNKIKTKYLEQIAKHNIPFEEGNHSIIKILEAAEIIKSPGIPNNSEVITEIRKKGIPVISDIEFASRYTNAKTNSNTNTK